MLLAIGLAAGSARGDTFNNGSTTFMSLGFLTGPTPQSKALGISADGTTVVGFSNSATDFQAFSLQITYPGTIGAPASFGPMTPLGSLSQSPTISQASGASNNGLVSGYSSSANTPGNIEGFVVQSNGQNIQALPPVTPGIFSSQASGINSAGTRIVGQAQSNIDGTTDAVFWNVSGTTPSTPTILPNYPAAGPSGYAVSANGVSGDGSVVVGFGLNGSFQNQATYWTVNGSTPSQPQPLPYLNFVSSSQATAVSPNGTDPTQPGNSFIAVGNSSAKVGPNQTIAGEAVAWTVDSSGPSAPLPLGFLIDPTLNPNGPFQSNANGISDSKGYLTTVVGSSIGFDPTNPTPTPEQQAFSLVLADNNPNNPPVMQSLKARLNNGEYNLQIPDGWKLVEAMAVSADGNTIVGYGINPLGQTEAWVVVLATPEPGSLSLIGLCAAAMLKRPRRR
jgi:uncharacterized membrane protein